MTHQREDADASCDHRAPIPWLERLTAGRTAVALGVLLSLTSLGVGFLADDHWFVAQMQHRLPDARAWWDLYRFTATTDEGNRGAISAGMLPWWTDPHLRIRFLRPLSSGLLSADFHVFGLRPVGWHLHEIVWWCLFLFALRQLYRRLLPGASGNVAVLLVALSPACAQAYGWLAASHLVVAGVFSASALLAHIRAREDGWRAGSWLAPAMLLLGLSAGESGLSGAAFWISYELVGPSHLGALRARMVGAAPAVVLSAVYLGVYGAFDFGVQASGSYVSPFHDPAGFAAAAALRLPMLVGQALVGLPVEGALARGSWPYAVIGLGAAATLFAVWRTCRAAIPALERAAVPWLALGGLTATLVTVGAVPAGRMLLVTAPMFAPLVAILICRAGGPVGAWRLARRTVVVILAVMHVVLAPLSSAASSLVGAGIGHETERVAAAMRDDVGTASRVFLVTPDPMVAVYAPTLALGDGRWPCWSWVSGVHALHRVAFDGKSSVTLEVLGASFVAGPWPPLYRRRGHPMHAGDEIDQCEARIRVEVTDDGLPTRIRLSFGAAPDAPGLVAWDGTKLVRLGPPPGRTDTLIAP